MQKLLAKLLLKLLRRNNQEVKALILTGLLDKVGALPIQNALYFTQDGQLLVKGKKLDTEQYIYLRDSFMALQDSQAEKFLNEQLQFQAIEYGIHKGISTETIVFSKAVLWVIEQRKKFINQIVNS